MSMEVKFRIKDDDRLYDNPVDATNRGAYLSQNNGGIPMVVQRGVKFKHRKEFEWYSLGKVEFPDMGPDGPIAYDVDENGIETSLYGPYNEPEDTRF